MKIDDSQKKQLIILCCLVAVLVSVGAYRVIGLSGHVATQGHEPSQAIEESNQAAAGQGDESRDQIAPGPPAKVSTSGQVSRDPFEPQVVPEAARSQTAVNTVPEQPPLIAQGTPLPLVGPFPPQSIGFEPIPASEEDPARVLRLTGVIEGDTNIAIIRGAGGERYIVREGQKIDGRYVVQSISRAGVRLRFKDKSFVLGLADNQAS